MYCMLNESMSRPTSFPLRNVGPITKKNSKNSDFSSKLHVPIDFNQQQF